MADRSWGVGAVPTRFVEGETATTRLDARAGARRASATAREEERRARRDADRQLSESDPHRAAAQRRRGSGRKDIVRVQRDTSGYATVADHDRLRALAARGASAEALAAAFGMSAARVAEIVADAD